MLTYFTFLYLVFQFFVRPTLVPSAEEKVQLFYERLHSYVDNADDIIDQISSFLGGNVILRNNPRIVVGEEAHNNTSCSTPDSLPPSPHPPSSEGPSNQIFVDSSMPPP